MPMARMISKFDNADTTTDPVVPRAIPAASAASRIRATPVITPENSAANRRQLTDGAPLRSGSCPSLDIAASLTRVRSSLTGFDKQGEQSGRRSS